MAKTELTPKQKAFVSAYVATGNATEAARRAGYSGNDKTLQVMGAKNISNAMVKQAIEARQKKRSERLELAEDYELSIATDLIDKLKDDLYDDEGRLNRGLADTLLKATDLAAKLRGKYVFKQEIKVAGDVSSRLEELLDDAGRS